MVQGKETLTYAELAEIRNNINTIIEDMNTNLKNAKEIIASCQSDGVFVTDQGSVSMQEKFNEVAAGFEPFIEKLKAYSDFLTQELTVTYESTDQELSTIWKNVAEAFSNFSNS